MTVLLWSSSLLLIVTVAHLCLCLDTATSPQAGPNSPSVYCKELSSASEVYDVVIVGGGVAGMTAAHTLFFNYSISNLTILEARDRIGGRVNTIVEGSHVLELGAQYIYGANDNPIFKIAEKNSFYVPSGSIEAVDDEFYTQAGVEVGYDFIDDCETMLDGLRNAVYAKGDYNMSYGDKLQKTFGMTIPKSDLNYVLKKSYLDLRSREFSANVGEEVENENLAQETDYHVYDGPHLQMQDGYYKILEVLNNGLPGSVVQGISKVTKIFWDIRCPAGDPSANYNGLGAVRMDDGRLIVGKYIICTLPLGILKSGDVAFVPNMRTSNSVVAKRKASAISRLGVACLNKLFLKWSQRWWPNSTDSINILWIRDNPMQDGIRFNETCYKTVEEKLWYRKITGFNSFYGQPAMLQTLIYGKWARLVEKLPESEIQSVLMQVIRLASGPTYGNHIPDPEKIITTAWCSDEFSQGSFSFLNMRTTIADFRYLAQPLPSDSNPVVLFAGEATETDQWATVAAAWKSGIREANRIGRRLKGTSLPPPL